MPVSRFFLAAIAFDGGRNRNSCRQRARERQMDSRREEWVDEGLNRGLKSVEQRCEFLPLLTSGVSDKPPSIPSIPVR